MRIAAQAELAHVLAGTDELGVEQGHDVRHVDGGAIDGRASRERGAVVRNAMRACERLGRRPRAVLVSRHRRHHAAVDEQHARKVGLAQERGALGNDVEHRTDVGGRARHHAQDLVDRLLLLECVGELVGALLHLALEARVRLAQLRGHAIEAVGERLQLVAGMHFDRLVEVALADPLRALGRACGSGGSFRAWRRESQA